LEPLALGTSLSARRLAGLSSGELTRLWPQSYRQGYITEPVAHNARQLF